MGAGVIRRALTVAALALGLTLTVTPAASARPFQECDLWHGTNYCDAVDAAHRAADRKTGQDCRTSWADQRRNCESQA